MDWLLQALEKLGIAIPDRDAESLQTVGQFNYALSTDLMK
jgi:acyl carrier protein